jgi:hypothetical protein
VFTAGCVHFADFAENYRNMQIPFIKAALRQLSSTYCHFLHEKKILSFEDGLGCGTLR